jgi:type I restriction enzyme M protein
VDRIVETYQYRREEPHYSRRVSLEEIRQNEFNLNITRYVSTAKAEPEIDLQQVHQELAELTRKMEEARARHNAFLKELGLPELR